MTHPTHRPRRSGNSGFTLTELLVASAIFVILMTALATLFNAAVSATRQGYASIEANDTARAAVMTISRDLTGAFTAREHGDSYNFYGRPDSFTFVGNLDGGNLGRVSYVFHKEEKNQPLPTTVTERWGEVVANVQRQARRIGREMGIYGTLLDTAVNDAVRRLEGVYGTHADTDLVDFDVLVETESLIRLEEPGANDLDTFDMYVKDRSTTPVVLTWPYVDAIDPAKDSLVAGPPMDANQTAQFQFLMGALDATPSTTGDDLRDLYAQINRGGDPSCPNGGWQNPVTLECMSLRVLGPDTFNQLLNARKREFWLRMLSDDLGLYTPTDLMPAPADGSTGYWYDEGFGVLNNPREMRNLNEHVLATGIIASVSVVDPTTKNGIEIISGTAASLGKFVNMDLYDADPRFSYGDAQTAEDWSGNDGRDNDNDGLIDERDELSSISYRTEATYLHYFNAIDNLRDPNAPDAFIQATGSPANIPGLLQNANPIDAQDLVFADNRLADNLLGNRDSNKNLGSPLLPRLPAVVTLDIWVTRPRTRPGAPDFRRRFTQSILVPTAQGRDVSSTIALGPGASL